jgi:hypothetical protein
MHTLFISSGGAKPRKGRLLLYGGIAIILAVALLSGCSLSETTPSQPVIPEPPKLSYSVSVSAVPIQISSGNLHWHRELPSDSYTLEDMAVEIHNLADFDVSIAQLEIRIDDDSRLFNVDRLIAGGARESVALKPMMEGYDGGVHCVYISLLDGNGGVLYQNGGQDIGPLEPEPGTGSWHPMSS